ncbi:MAG: hypothetical protein WD069_12105 [Planctomycetales bacterium]
MKDLCLTIVRLSLAGWVGGAGLFVVTSVREQVAPDFDHQTRAALALVRFPAYYLFGFALLGTAFVAGVVGFDPARFGRGRRWLCLGLVLAALAVTAVDYVWVYRPLESMLEQPPALRPATFNAYHAMSESINLAHVGLSFAAACAACWPSRGAS